MEEPGWVDTLWTLFAPHVVQTQRMLLAIACGAIIGWERERAQKGAGFRTNILMSLGACIFALIGLSMHRQFPASDPLRLVQGVLQGIGFLSGGVIVVQGATIRGLTTATGLWLLTAIGMAAGLGHYFLAVAGTFFAYIIMSWFRRLEKEIQRSAMMEKAAAETTEGGTE